MRAISITAILATLMLVGMWPRFPTPVAAGLLMAPPSSASEELAIIVNRSNPTDNLSFADVRKVFLAEFRTWPNGRKITLVMREKGQPERDAVLRLIYRMNESYFNRYFLQANFTGQLQAEPKQLTTSAGVRRFIFNVPGAIGYVRADEVDDSVKVVRVDGRLPGEAGYKVKLAR